MDLRVLAWTESAPNLPYVTAIDRDNETIMRLRVGLWAAIGDPRGASARSALSNDLEVFEPINTGRWTLRNGPLLLLGTSS